MIATINTDHHFDGLPIDFGAAVEVTIGAKLFYELHSGLQALARARDGEILWSDSYRDARSGSTLKSLAVNLDGCGTKLNSTVHNVSFKKVHRG